MKERNLKAALYARYSSDLQSESSIEDQIRLCSEYAGKNNLEIINCYSDAGLSGASLMRPGIQSLLADALSGKFEMVLAEALDRLSRDQEDIAGIYKRLEFAGVKIITLSEGEISSLHIGLKGTMNAMFLRDLADKTRRGLRGCIESGKSGGGIAYGYDVVKRFNAAGEAIKGDRTVNEDQAAVIRRIFEEYGKKNRSPKAIAAQLNKDGIPSPSGKGWTQSTINGNRKRGTGILNNELYIGRLIWNRQRFIKDPETGRRVTRLNDEADWIIQEVPELRIVPQDLWDAAKARQGELDKKAPGLWRRNRPQYLLSGLAKCGVCGGGYAKINATQYGCATAKNKGEAYCTNRKTIKREALEEFVLSGLQSRLMRDDLLKLFCEEYTSHMNQLRAAQDSVLIGHRKEQAKLVKERENVLQAIREGISASLVKDDLERIAARLEELDEFIASGQSEVRPFLHPSMAERYRLTIERLRESLNREDSRTEASEHLRRMIEKVVLTPIKGKEDLQIDLYGDLAGILNLSRSSGKDQVSAEENLKRLRLLPTNNIPSNDNGQQASVDRIGSGGRI